MKYSHVWHPGAGCQISFIGYTLKLCAYSASKLKVDEIDRYINGLKNDLQAVKNAITYPYNNGLAEGSVNKIKLTKRIMYGRNSFMLLKAKLLINEYFYQIN